MQAPSRRFLLASLVYGGVLAFLVCLAALAGSFTQMVDGARISGRFSPFPLFNRTGLETLTISWNGLDLRLSRVGLPGALRFETAGGEADIVAGDMRLRLSTPDDRGTALTISQVAGPGAPPRAVLSIPFKLAGILKGDSAQTLLSWRTGGGAFQLQLPADAQIDYRERSISLHLGQALPSLRFAALSPASQQELPSRALPLPQERSLPTQQQLSAVLSRFSDLAYTGWSVSRFSSPEGTWRLADGTEGISEEIGVGLLAESVARGTFSDVVQTWINALDDRPVRSAAPEVPTTTCVFTGKVRDFARDAQDRDAAEIDRLKGLIARGDPTLADRPGVLLFVLDRGGAGLAKSALAALRAADAGRLSLLQLLTVLQSLEDYQQYVGDDPSVVPAVRDLIEQRLIPRVASTGDGAVFVQAPDSGRVDLKQSLRCGSLLLRAGALVQDSRIGSLGRGLLVSSLSLAADAGFLPATLTLASGRIASREGALAPEAVYPLLPAGRHLPHETPLGRIMGNGCWAWTAADLVSADQADATVRLVFSYPAGVPHHLVFQGLRPFEQIRLHGIPWHSDPSYVRYSDGWTYDEQAKTLFMKITGRQDREEVDLTF